MTIKQFFENIGIYKVNSQYTQPLDNKLSEIEEDFRSVEHVSDYSERVISALNAHDNASAVSAALQFFKIDDEAKELKKIQKKIAEGKVSVESATAAANTPFLIREIVFSAKNEISNNYKKINDLLPDIENLGTEISEKLQNIKVEAVGWSLAEKIGTPEAIRNTSRRAKKVKESAEAAKMKLENFVKSFEDLSNFEE